ncbi:MAG: DUF4382 domain-containing protein [Gemmatimonadota bacterium]
MSTFTRYSLLVSVLGLSLAACSDGMGPVRQTNSQVLLVPAVSADAAVLPASGTTITGVGPGDGTGPIHDVIPLAAVASIDVTLTGVQVKQWRRTFGGGGTGGPAGAPSGWTTVDVPDSPIIDLMNLPADGLTIAAGALEPGSYRQVRLLFSDAQITLSEDVTLPDSTVIAAGTYPLQVGGVDHDWFYVQTAQFTVTEDQADVIIEFDPAASVRAIVVLDDGTLVMPPVLRAWGQPFGSFQSGAGPRGPYGPNGPNSP